MDPAFAPSACAGNAATAPYCCESRDGEDRRVRPGHISLLASRWRSSRPGPLQGRPIQWPNPTAVRRL